MSNILGPDGMTASFPTGGLDKKTPIADMRIVMTAKMMVHPQTKEMVMVPIQDVQYKRVGSDEWFSLPIVEVEKHEFNPEEKKSGIISNEN
jgi:hypothetical protein